MPPIQNIYYLLSYAWELAEEWEHLQLSGSEQAQAGELVAKLFLNQCQKHLRRGWRMGYVEKEGERNTIRGRVNWRKTRTLQGKAYCHYEELSNDSLANRLLIQSLKEMGTSPALSMKTKTKARRLQRSFPQLTPLKLSKDPFDRLRRQNLPAPYPALCHQASLWFQLALPTETPGKYYFPDVMREPERMARLFECFVRNFFRQESRRFRVGREHIRWDSQPLQVEGEGLLPRMETDISLFSPDQKIIIETKFYPEALADNRFGSKKFRSQHLYQLFAYLKNVETKDEASRHAKGILLYPTAGQTEGYDYKMEGHLMSICSLSLNQDWQGIHRDLLEIIGER